MRFASAFALIAVAALGGCTAFAPAAPTVSALPTQPVAATTLAPPRDPAPATTGSLPPATQRIVAAPDAPPPPPAAAFVPMSSPDIAGAWTAREGDATPCRLLLGAVGAASPPRAEPEGCLADDLRRVAGWQTRGQDLMLLDGRGSPVALLRPTGPRRYEGVGVSRARLALER